MCGLYLLLHFAQVNKQREECSGKSGSFVFLIKLFALNFLHCDQSLGSSTSFPLLKTNREVQASIHSIFLKGMPGIK